MVLMENGKMDSNSVVVDSCIIMDHGNESIRTCLGDEDEHLVTFQDDDNVTRENKFVRCNGNPVKRDELSNLTNGIRMCNIRYEDSYSSNPKGSNSSQCSISSAQKTMNSSLENNLSNLSIRTDHEVVTSKSIESNYQNCNSSSRNEECSSESTLDSASSIQNDPKTDICASEPSLVQEDVHKSQRSEKEKDGDSASEVVYICYESEKQMPDIMKLIQKDLSEPYSIYTYRYFIHNWPHLCFLAISKGNSVGAIVCKLDIHRKVIKRGYIAMLAVDESYRKHGIGSNLVLKAIRVMAAEGADEVVLETEITNQPALRLYENLGFVRDKRLFRYYLNGVDALRLKLWLR